jgi:hypothetical protein
MEIITKNIELCVECNNYKGTVEEKHNGKVPVYCTCTLEEERIKYNGWRSPCMICPNGNKFFWTPISSHYESDGKWWHTPYFSPVEPLNRRKANTALGV